MQRQISGKRRGSTRSTLTRRTPVVSDSFTDTNGVSISSHTPETYYSGLWSQTSGTSFYIQNNQLQANRHNDGDLATINTELSDYTIYSYLIPYNVGGNFSIPSIVFRYSNSSNFWYCQLNSSSGFVELYTVVAGSHIRVCRYQTAIPSNAERLLKVDCRGPYITISLDNTELMTYRNTFNINSTTCGVRLGVAGSPVAKCSWNSFVCGAFSGPTINWPDYTEYSVSNPIIALGGGGSWDSTDINNPNVLYDNSNSRWVLSYSGYKTGTGNAQGLGLAYATNLIGPWTKEVTNPVFTGGGSYGQNGGMIKRGSTYYYYYGSGGASQISLATSTNLLSWTDFGVVLGGGSSGSWDQGGVFDAFVRLKEDGITFELWYAGTGTLGRAIGFATSTDGTNFTRSPLNPVMRPPPYAGSTSTFGEPSVFVPSGYSEKVYLLSFDSAEGDSSNTRFVSQAITFDGMSTWHHRPYAIKAGSGWQSAQVFDNFVMEDSGYTYIYHSGSDLFGAALDLNIQIGVASGQAPIF